MRLRASFRDDRALRVRPWSTFTFSPIRVAWRVPTSAAVTMNRQRLAGGAHGIVIHIDLVLMTERAKTVHVEALPKPWQHLTQMMGHVPNRQILPPEVAGIRPFQQQLYDMNDLCRAG